MQLSIRDLTFAYPGGEPVFEHLNLNLDTGWRLGVIGRNGRGKTTLLRLMMRCMPFEGAIDLPLEAAYFPYEVPDTSPFPHLAGANRPRHCSARCLRGRMPIP